MRLKVLKAVRKNDVIDDDFKAAVQLELAAKNALRKSKDIFEKIIHSKETDLDTLEDAKKQFDLVKKSLSYL